VTEGLFRSDLYFRLRVIDIRLPPLRERSEDLEALASFLLDKACRRLNRPPPQFAPQTIAAINAYHWPGNVRELENAIERAVILCETAEITPELLAIDAVVHPATTTTVGPALSLKDYFRHFVLDHQDRLTETELAGRLGLSRKALWERRQRFGIPRPKDN
jgi:DNA-binding NtrC family response regulator